ncbi:exopolysaccharide biosynthesis protein [Rhizobium leguminosarum]|uniref:polysaccharide biosynthesis/export family protein n=1 Tax=Rhizobium TaxID=379 RepID=UPI001030EB88|nr:MULTISPECIES: polysaccharide biosynthesis/export family protein [Rhizobium]MDV4155765.1 exopolysaccharide biosynthesis protein [Rhizobium brockwellii]TAX26175.1 exopolysaccharide biosynthesis protein [Rhizobium leguminosarum]TAX84707.1 exopolysaccharide biosynthesis protein [Rhizobium leguminosarum]TAX85903.1 exopolysaccharide biosynthesis protein [Rhizobium leguminosarum]TAY84502.1 exopolysaccharide biosynthesis protein [Rhizobium leguminosarum]
MYMNLLRLRRPPRVSFRATSVISALVLLAGAVSPALADSAPLAPQTRIRLTIVQWIPSKGQFERWDGIGGDYTVSDAGVVSLPFLGALSVGNLDNEELTSEIGKRLQAKMGLAQAPAVTIDILDYPSIYVVGDVVAPGEYKFRSGLSVLQSLAMSGGPLRAAALQQSQTIRLAGDLREIDHSLLRSSAKLARLQTEMAGAKEIVFDQPPAAERQYAESLYQEERVIFKARANALDKQSVALAELRNLLTAEIDTLEEKLKGSDDNIQSVEEQLTSVKTLVQKGLTITSRQMDLERLLTTYRSDRLDLVTAIMRGRQAINETTRNLEGLSDTRRSEIASEVQAEKANLDQLKLKRDTTQQLLLEDLSNGANVNSRVEELPLTFLVNRRDKGQVNQFQATETTELAPGDVIRVSRPRIADAPSEDAAALPVQTEAHVSQVSR